MTFEIPKRKRTSKSRALSAGENFLLKQIADMVTDHIAEPEKKPPYTLVSPEKFEDIEKWAQIRKRDGTVQDTSLQGFARKLADLAKREITEHKFSSFVTETDDGTDAVCVALKR